MIHTIVHFLPSSSFLGGFFILMLSGLGFLPGAGLFGRPAKLSETEVSARREGFLCVISDLSTLRRPFVTSDPLFSSENTAPKPPPPPAAGEGAAAGAACSLISSTGGGPGGGGGGGGGAPPAGGGGGAGLPEGAGAGESNDLATVCAGWPLGFQTMPLGKYCLT